MYTFHPLREWIIQQNLILILPYPHKNKREVRNCCESPCALGLVPDDCLAAQNTSPFDSYILFTMDGHRMVPNCYAILIGINAYKAKPLGGCVRDIENIQAYLKSGIDLVDVRTFTATGNVESGSTSLIENPKFWPTDINIRGALEEVTQSAVAGDCVYIHYSGHGTREIPNDRSYNKSTGDLALVVLSGETLRPEKYFYGRSLAYSLNAMVQKGLIVTLVLDCCFSASIYRSEPSVRFLPYDTETALIANSENDWKPDDSPSDNSASRDISMFLNWLINPDKYAIFVACGPQEEAGEIELTDGSVVGKLSHYLVKVLKEDGGVGNSVNHIYERLRSEFHSGGLQESPMLYGNKSQSFLGVALMRSLTKQIPVSKTIGGGLELHAGLAHGIGPGDRFTLYPSDQSIIVSQGEYKIVQVTRAGAFVSDIEQINMYSIPFRGRPLAKPLSQRSLRKYAVRLTLPPSQVDELRMALDKRSLSSHNAVDGRAFSFEITFNSREGYEINDEFGQVNASLPVLLSSEASVDEIGDTLERLIRFRLVKDLDNAASAPAFRKAFDIHMTYRGNSFKPGSLIEVNDGDRVDMVVTNLAARNLFLSTYNLGPSWQVENIERATFTVMPAARVEDNRSSTSTRSEVRKLQMRIPDDIRKRYRSCTDIVKVFVTSRPTSFDFLELPRLSEPSGTMGETNRTPHGHNYPEDEWVGLSFHIHTSAPDFSSD